MRVGFIVASLMLVGCGDDSSPGTDAGSMDSSMLDSGGDDAGGDDAGGDDAGGDDAGADDAAMDDAAMDDAGSGTVPIACAPPQEIDAPWALVFLCEIELETCRLFGPNGTDVREMRNRCGDDGDTVDLIFDHDFPSLEDPFVRTGGGWTIVASTLGTIQTGPSGDTQLISLDPDVEITTTIEDEGGARYDVTYSFANDPNRLVVTAITAL